MLKTLRTIDRDVVDALVDATSGNGDAVALERDGERVVVAISMAAYEDLAEAKRQQDWAKILAYAESEPFGHLTSEELGAWIDAEVEAVRKERFKAGHHG